MKKREIENRNSQSEKHYKKLWYHKNKKTN